MVTVLHICQCEASTWLSKVPHRHFVCIGSVAFVLNHVNVGGRPVLQNDNGDYYGLENLRISQSTLVGRNDKLNQNDLLELYIMIQPAATA